MKKWFVAFSVCLMSTGVFADLAIEVENQGSSYFKADNSGEVNEAFVQLIWADNLAGKAGNGGSLAIGETLIHSFTTFAGAGGTWDSGEGDTFAGVKYFDDEAIGGSAGSDSSILNGYFFFRVYDNVAMDIGDYYLQQYVNSPVLIRYNSLDTTTIYDEGSYGGLIGSGTVGAHQVVPEPAVVSLIGIFGVGIIFTKRIFSKA